MRGIGTPGVMSGDRVDFETGARLGSKIARTSSSTLALWKTTKIGSADARTSASWFLMERKD